MKSIKKIVRKFMNSMWGSKCPKCGEWMDQDEEVCQTCGYPWSD